jgi:ribosomal protein L6P/L9E
MLQLNIITLTNLNFLITQNYKNKQLIIFNKNKYILFYIIDIFYNKNNNQIVFLNNFKENNFFIMLKNIFYNFSTKIKFTGKGYKIKKTPNKIIFHFNRAHINVLLIKNLIVKKIKKNKMILKGSNSNFKKAIKDILNVRLLNVFTKRGLRLSRSLILKKQGKKSLKNN